MEVTILNLEIDQEIKIDSSYFKLGKKKQSQSSDSSGSMISTPVQEGDYWYNVPDYDEDPEVVKRKIVERILSQHKTRW